MGGPRQERFLHHANNERTLFFVDEPFGNHRATALVAACRAMLSRVATTLTT